jgi:hypothetical protein
MNERTSRISRRRFLGTGSLACASLAMDIRRGEGASAPPAREIGITTSSIDAHIGATSAGGKIGIMDLPRLMREELDMRVIDLNSNTLAKAGRRIEEFRSQVEKFGCVVTNLKMNQKGLAMNSPDDATRTKALSVYMKSIDDAALVGSPWARPLPLPPLPDMKIHVASYRALAEHGKQHGVGLLVENYGWMQADPDSVPRLIKRIDRGVMATPDTGNWNSDEIRYAGLKKAFPLAVSCDFKAKAMGPDGEHKAYDLKRCFDVGWRSGFRGPWCLEHANRDRKALFRELTQLREMLRAWMKTAAR